MKPITTQQTVIYLISYNETRCSRHFHIYMGTDRALFILLYRTYAIQNPIQ